MQALPLAVSEQIVGLTQASPLARRPYFYVFLCNSCTNGAIIRALARSRTSDRAEAAGAGQEEHRFRNMEGDAGMRSRRCDQIAVNDHFRIVVDAFEEDHDPLFTFEFPLEDAG